MSYCQPKVAFVVGCIETSQQYISRQKQAHESRSVNDENPFRPNSYFQSLLGSGMLFFNLCMNTCFYSQRRRKFMEGSARQFNFTLALVSRCDATTKPLLIYFFPSCITMKTSTQFIIRESIGTMATVVLKCVPLSTFLFEQRLMKKKNSNNIRR